MTMDARAAEAAHLVQVYGQLPIEPVSADGVMLHTRDGREVMDLYGGHAVACLGYGHPRLTAVLEEQSHKMLFQSNAVALEVRARAARKLVEFSKTGLTKVFFANSGAEANENALRLALRFSGRSKVLALQHGFHGRTAAAGAVTWGSKSWYGFPSAPFQVEFIPRDSDAGLVHIDDSVAALIVEPVQGVAGAYDLDPSLLRAMAERCRRHGVLLILDEVQTGMGRLGEPFGANLFGIAPDMLTSAKSVAGGFPCAALLIGDELAGRLGPGDLGTTFGGGPVAAAMVAAVIDIISDDDLLANVRRQSELIRTSCAVGPVQGFQGAGFLLGLRTHRPAAEIRNGLLERDILVGTSADPNVVRLLPPYVLTSEHVARLAAALKELN